MPGGNPSNNIDTFLILGSSSPQRFEIVWQMAEYLYHHNESVTVCVHEEESDLPESATLDRLKQKGLSFTTWALKPDSTEFSQLPSAAKPTDTLLLIGHGGRYLVDTLEALSVWLPHSDCDLQRITTWVDCGRLGGDTQVKKWYECCFHFSDLVILDEFRDLPVSWLKEFRTYFKSQCYPCIVENTKRGRLHDLYLIMDNQVRRITQVFEISDDSYSDAIVEDEDDEDSPEEENEAFFERYPDGKRSKHVPDI